MKHFCKFLRILNDTFLEIFLNNIDKLFRNDEQLCFEGVREVVRIAASHSSRFCSVISEGGLLVALGNDLKNLKSFVETAPDVSTFISQFNFVALSSTI